MLFNSITFLIFLPIVFFGYWVLDSSINFRIGWRMRLQNLFIVITSYVFYGWWDWRFLILIALSSGWAWMLGLADEKWEHGRKARLILSLVLNLGLLGVFKYYNFFIGEASLLLQFFGFTPHIWTLRIALPVGISFYTFQTLSYTIDVYRKDIKPTRDPIAFFAFVSFFPQLVAGPIERATNLLPQFLKPRTFSYPDAVDGCRQMLWGFFKKMVIADHCALVTNHILSNWTDKSGLTIWIGIFCFTIQIYCDFSGYSDIAIGCSKLFGIRLMRNFAFPYFSRDIAEFWRRWHISLSTWFRDYVYIPLGGSHCSKSKQIRNTFIIFLVSGMWHGANWTFLVWGTIHACCFLPLLLLNRNRKYTDTVATGRIFPSFTEAWQIGATFFSVLTTWIFFRAESVTIARGWLLKMLTVDGGFTIEIEGVKTSLLICFFSISILFITEWFNRTKHYGCARYPSLLIPRWSIYILLGMAIIFLHGAQQEFIYFQF